MNFLYEVGHRLDESKKFGEKYVSILAAKIV